jgi:hypothetical protein
MLTSSRRLIAVAAAVVLMAGVGSTLAFMQSWRAPKTKDGIYLTTSDKAYVRQGYLAAMKRRDLLAQLPCHCGCMRKDGGHGSVLDCFRTDHAERCSICLRTAEYADRAAAEGRTVTEMKQYLSNVFEFTFE